MKFACADFAYLARDQRPWLPLDYVLMGDRAGTTLALDRVRKPATVAHDGSKALLEVW